MSEEEIHRLVIERMVADVEKYGWHVVAVFPTADEPGVQFQYTVGLGENHDHPELLIVGLNHQIGHQILKSVVDRIRDGERPRPFVRIPEIVRDYDVMFTPLPADEHPDWLGAGVAYYRERLDRPMQAMQIVWPDASNRFPWEGGETSSQRVLCPPPPSREEGR